MMFPFVKWQKTMAVCPLNLNKLPERQVAFLSSDGSLLLTWQRVEIVIRLVFCIILE